MSSKRSRIFITVTFKYYTGTALLVVPKILDILLSYIIFVYLCKIGLSEFFFSPLIDTVYVQNFIPELIQTLTSTNPGLWSRLRKETE